MRVASWKRVIPVVVVVSLGAAACGSPPASGMKLYHQLPPETTAPPPPTTNPQQAVIAGYVAASNAVTQASLAVNPYDPNLAATMVNPQLEHIQALLEVERANHATDRGYVNLGHPVVVSYSPTQATVRSCVDYDLIVYGPDGKPLPTILPAHLQR